MSGSAVYIYIRLARRGAGARLRAPALERLLLQASAPAATTDWRRDAFDVIAGTAALPSAAAALNASSGAVAGPWVCMASPVHFVAGMTNVTLSDGGILQLEPADSAALAADFNRVFGDSGARLSVARNAMLLCAFDRVVEVGTHDPLDVVGHDVFALQPTGADAARLRRLMSEMELWLFEHTVNQVRAARGSPVITGLWLWGGGETLSTLPHIQGWTAGSDPLFAAFGNAPEFPGVGATRSGVLVCEAVPGSEEWREVERRWLLPLSAALHAGQIDGLTVSVAERAVSVEKGMRWRFWRRPKPWWESFELAADEPQRIEDP